MSSIENRPYAGTWKLNQNKVVQHTPDALIFINGDTSVPGCARCSGRIDLQPYITGVNVEAGVDSGGHSVSLNLSIPAHLEDALARDADFILRPGLEIHVYMRGYFPVNDIFKASLTQKEVTRDGKVLQQTVAEKFKVSGLDLDKIPGYPYYHVFHGVVTQADHAFSGGFNTTSLNGSSMLHFWQYHNMSTNASVFGARPANSKLRLSIVGHNFTKMSPYEIIYTLHHDTAGAAGEVGYALSSKTNQTARSSITGNSLFSLNIEYWRKRFDSRMLNLRMHGVSGELFNSAQAAFLGRLSTSQTTRILRGRFAAKDQQTNTQNFMSAAKTLGFFGERAAQRLAYVEKSSPTKRKNEMNIGAMQAFATDIGSFGQLNYFESSYQSKLDIAKQVTEITGFEFYQDVDGDFVFKPPLYNLDTSASRVYRIEDIDIISLNHSEKEPDVTYMTVKGSHFKNLRGMGLDNEWGVRGQYIDYRLVAKFGWRPGSFETTYFNDPRSMFFAAVNRMDIMNAGVKSGSVTIPLRPEIRPGYPVYFPSMDCFYYVRSLSHAFQFGGQCTTSLQLVARRSKFYPPGDPNSEGIQAINLGDMIMPPRPLLGKGEGGRPRYFGFPNVVMALDPNKLNPLFFFVGSDIENISDPQTLTNFVKMAQSFGLVQEQQIDGRTVFKMGEEYFSLDSIPRKSKGGPTIIDLKAVSREFQRKRTLLDKTIVSQNKRLARFNWEILRLESRRTRLQKAKNPNTSKIEELSKQIYKKNEQYQKMLHSIQADRRKNEAELEKNPSIKMLITLLRSTKDAYLNKNSDYKNLNTSANLLDLLSDKKATFGNGSLPGAYRYYSCSHPNPADQGLPELVFSDQNKGTMSQKKSLLTSPGTVRGGGFKRYTTTPTKGSFRPEVEIDPNYKAQRGIKILSNDPKRPEKIVTTDQIRTLSFAVHRVLKNFYVTNYKIESGTISLSSTLRNAVLFPFFGQNANLSVAKSVRECYQTAWNSISNWVDDKNIQLISGKSGPVYPFGSGTVNIPGFGTVDPSKTASEVLETAQQSSASALSRLGVALSTYLQQEWYRQGNTLMQNFYNLSVKPKLEKANQKGASRADHRAAAEAYTQLHKAHDTIYAIVKRKAPKIKNVRKQSHLVERRLPISSPVFPVSDSKGYEVVGTYQYGRDIDIDPQGAMQQLYKLDMFKFADRTAVENYVDAMMGKTITVRIKTGDKYVERRVGGQTALEESQKQLVQSIRSNPNAVGVLSRLVPSTNASVVDAGQLDVALSNWIADHRDGVSKLPVINAAYSLADLHNHVKKRACTCRTAGAEVLTLAMSQDRFVNVTKKSDPTRDTPTGWIKDRIENNSAAYLQHQNVLRGSVLEGRNRSLIETFKGEISKFSQTTNDGIRGLETIQDQAQNLAKKILGDE